MGQFDVMVDGQSIASRKGGLLASLINRPFPDKEEVIASIAAAIPK